MASQTFQPGRYHLYSKEYFQQPHSNQQEPERSHMGWFTLTNTHGGFMNVNGCYCDYMEEIYNMVFERLAFRPNKQDFYAELDNDEGACGMDYRGFLRMKAMPGVLDDRGQQVWEGSFEFKVIYTRSLGCGRPKGEWATYFMDFWAYRAGDVSEQGEDYRTDDAPGSDGEEDYDGKW